jgi:hypothetical protein
MAPIQHKLLVVLPPTAFLAGGIFLAFYVLKFAFHVIYARFALRNIPGPLALSLIWGEEWRLYSNPPGSLYVQWHKQFGKVIKFSGAFGVSDHC